MNNWSGVMSVGLVLSYVESQRNKGCLYKLVLLPAVKKIKRKICQVCFDLK
jgi:hypothetical protein